MKPDNWNRFAAGLLAILLCLCSFSMPAFSSAAADTTVQSIINAQSTAVKIFFNTIIPPFVFYVDLLEFVYYNYYIPY